MTGFKAVLLDWDQTLVDSADFIKQNGEIVASKYGVLNEFTEARKEHLSSRELFPKVFGEFAEPALKEYYELHSLIKEIKIMPGALEFLDFLNSRSLLVAVVSNKNKKQLLKEVEILGWQKYFNIIIASADAEFDKPHPASIYLAMQNLNILKNEEVLFLGDSDVDAQACKNANIDFVRITVEKDFIEAKHKILLTNLY